MLATLRNIFSVAAIVQTLKIMEPLATTVMDLFFKNRPTHPLPLIGLADLKQATRTVPLVRRDGTPVSLEGDEFEAQFIAPLPIKVKVNVSASELNDLRAMLQQPQAVEAWRRNKLEQIRATARNTTEGLCTVVLNTGKVSWPVALEGGRAETYEVDYGAPLTHTPGAKLTAASKPSAVYALLRAMDQMIKQAGMGGKVEFLAGTDVVAVLMDIADASRTTVQANPIRMDLSASKISIGNYAVHFMDEFYPAPVSGEWLPKVDAKSLIAVAVDQPGTVYYCAIDSISANNAAVPLHVVPVARDDDSGITLIGQTKPLPARPSRATCKCVAVD
ncbi:MAG: major capsid protein [Desulfovibrio sp.]|jgi:hypothetical protein|nr:major capsid protein [Desulfovibrio sp.]